MQPRPGFWSGQVRLAMLGRTELEGLRGNLQPRGQDLPQPAMRHREAVAVQRRQESRRPRLLPGRQQRMQAGYIRSSKVEWKYAQPPATQGSLARPGCQIPADGFRQRLIPEARRGSSTGAAACASSDL